MWFFCKKKDFFCRFFNYLYIFAIIITLLNILSMKNLVTKIQEQFDVFTTNAGAQVEKGNKAAGTRARKAALEISKLMKEFRKISIDATK